MDTRERSRTRKVIYAVAIIGLVWWFGSGIVKDHIRGDVTTACANAWIPTMPAGQRPTAENMPMPAVCDKLTEDQRQDMWATVAGVYAGSVNP